MVRSSGYGDSAVAEPVTSQGPQVIAGDAYRWGALLPSPRFDRDAVGQSLRERSRRPLHHSHSTEDWKGRRCRRSQTVSDDHPCGEGNGYFAPKEPEEHRRLQEHEHEDRKVAVLSTESERGFRRSDFHVIGPRSPDGSSPGPPDRPGRPVVPRCLVSRRSGFAGRFRFPRSLSRPKRWPAGRTRVQRARHD